MFGVVILRWARPKEKGERAEREGKGEAGRAGKGRGGGLVWANKTDESKLPGQGEGAKIIGYASPPAWAWGSKATTPFIVVGGDYTLVCLGGDALLNHFTVLSQSSCPCCFFSCFCCLVLTYFLLLPVSFAGTPLSPASCTSVQYSNSHFWEREGYHS